MSRPSLITQVYPKMVNGHSWLELRPLTMDDVIFSDWLFSNKISLPDGARSEVCAWTKMEVKYEVYAFDAPEGTTMDELKRTFFNGRHLMVRCAEFVIRLEFRGTRKPQQVEKYNNAIEELHEMVLRDGDRKKQECLDKLNEDLHYWETARQGQYKEILVRCMSQVSSYDIGQVDVLAETQNLVQEIKTLRETLVAKEKELAEKRQEVIRKNWEGPKEGYPEEALMALRERLATQKPQVPIDCWPA